jgi:hypothetical protein
MLLPLKTVGVEVLEGCKLVLTTNGKIIEGSWVLGLVVEL